MPKQPLLYEQVKEIIMAIPDPRTKALVAFQYATGCRVGELCFEYEHKFQEGDKKWKERTEGLKRENIIVRDDHIIIRRPNFKQGQHKIGEVDSVIYQKEDWLYKTVVDWLQKTHGKFVFYLKESRARELIRKAIGKSSHYLRHSRGFHLRERFKLDAYEIQIQLGHKNVQTSTIYVHASVSGVLDKMRRAYV